MRTTVPAAFEMQFDGADGNYSVSFQPTDEWDGYIDVSIRGCALRWEVIDADRGNDGGIVLGGMTTGSDALWDDQFWFELRLSDRPPMIRYWGDKVVWREDLAVEPNRSQQAG